MKLFFGICRYEGGIDVRVKAEALEKFLIKFTFWLGLSIFVFLYGTGYYESYGKIHPSSMLAGLVVIWQIVGLLSGTAILRENLRAIQNAETEDRGSMYDAEDWLEEDEYDDYIYNRRKIEQYIWRDWWITIILFCLTIFITSGFFGWKYL